VVSNRKAYRVSRNCITYRLQFTPAPGQRRFRGRRDRCP